MIGVEPFYAGLMEGVGVTGFIMSIIICNNSKKYLEKIKKSNRILINMCDKLRKNPKFTVMEEKK